MVNRAVIVNDNYICSASSRQLVPGYPGPGYPATMSAFVLSRRSDIVGGTMYLDEVPSSVGAMSILDAGLTKVVYAKPAESEDQVAAIQILEQGGVETRYNPDIIL